MADEVKIPISLEVTDLDMSSVNPKDIEKGLKGKLTELRKSVDGVFKSLDASPMSKEFSRAAAKMNSSFRTVESTVKGLSKTLKAVDEGKASMEHVEKAAKDVTSALSNADEVFKSFSENANVESTLTMGFRNSYTIAQDLVKELQYYENTAEKAAQSSNTTAEYWQQLDTYTKATRENLRGVLAELREMVKNGSAFKLGASDDKGAYMKMLQSLQTRGQNSAGRAGFLAGQAGAAAPQALIDAKKEVIALERELQKAQWEFEALKKTDVGTARIREAEAAVNNLAMRLEASRASFESLEASMSNVSNSATEAATETSAVAGATQEVASGMYMSDAAAAKLDATLNAILRAVIELVSSSNEAGEEIEKSFSRTGEKADHAKNKVNGLNESFRATRNVTTAMIMTLQQFGSIGTIIAQVIGIVQLLADAFRDVATAAHSVIPIIGIFLGLAVNVFGRVISLLKKILALLKQIALAILDVAKKVGGVLLSSVKKLASAFKSLIPSKDMLTRLKSFLTRYLLGFRSSYFLIRKIRQAVIDGMKDIAAAAPEVNEYMSNFSTALNQLKGNLTAAFEPILSVALPALTRLMEVLAKVLTLIAKFNAVLVGRDYYYDYAAAMQDYADGIGGVGKAAKKAQKDLMGFDEINRLSAPNEPSGGGSGLGGEFKKTAIDTADAVSRFAEMVKEAWEKADFTKVGGTVGKKIYDAIANFNSAENQAYIRKTAEKFATSIATFINGLVEQDGGIQKFFDKNHVSFGTQVGKAIANLFNTAFDALYMFATTVHWDSVGKFLGDGIAGALENFHWGTLFSTIAEFVNGLATMISNAVKNHNWLEIGKDVAEGLIQGLNKFDPVAAGQAVHDFVMAIIDMVRGFVDKLNDPVSIMTPAKGGRGFNVTTAKSGWSFIGKKIKEFFESMNTPEMGQAVAETLINIINGASELITVADFGSATGGFISTFFDAMEKDDSWEKSFENLWDNLHPKIMKVLEWGKPKLEAFVHKLWELLKGPVLDLAVEIGTTVGGAIWDALKPSAEDVYDATIGQVPLMKEYKELGKQTGADLFSIAPASGFGSVSEMVKYYKSIKKIADLTPEQQKQFESSDTYKNNAAAREVYEMYKTKYPEAAATTTNANKEVSKSMQTTSKATSDYSNVVKSTSETSKVAFTQTSSGAKTMSASVVGNFNSMEATMQTTMGSLGPASQQAYSSVTKTFDQIPTYFSNTFGTAWGEILKSMQVGGELQVGLAASVNAVVTSSVNRMVDAINSVAITPLIRLDNLLEKLKNVKFGGITPFAALPRLGFSKIPKLAQGAVLPPNDPFLSIVGDQKSGTNIEAPLETIQQAVANVLDEQLAGMMAGFEAVVNAIQNKDMSVIIGDREIGQANDRYMNRRTNMLGG